MTLASGGLDVDLVDVETPALPEIGRQASHAVARHLRGRPVGVREVESERGRNARTDADHAVGARAHPPIAQRRDVDVGYRTIELVEDQEVVPRCLILREAQGVRHADPR